MVVSDGQVEREAKRAISDRETKASRRSRPLFLPFSSFLFKITNSGPLRHAPRLR